MVIKSKLKFFSFLLVIFLLNCNSNLKYANHNSYEQILEKFQNPQSESVFVTAHRAVHINYPGNSIAAINEAIQIGVDIIEIDIRQTKDSVLVLMHDEEISKLTNGKGFIHEMMYSEIKNINLNIKSREDTIIHFIPTLKEVFEITKKKIFIDLDIKNAPVNNLLKLIHETGMQEQVIIFESDFTYLDNVIAIDSTIMIMPRAHSFDEFEGIINRYHPFAIHIDLDFLNDKTVNLADSSDVFVFVKSLGWPDIKAWFGLSKFVFGLMVKNGADIIQTDQPYLLINYLRKEYNK